MAMGYSSYIPAQKIEDEAMSVASDVSKDKKSFSTEWSCVYNLDAFTFDICLDRDYGTKYSFTKEDFR